jgi:hypothetical protein
MVVAVGYKKIIIFSLKTKNTMRVFVDWDTDGYSVEELGLDTVIDMPTLNEEEIADYLSDNYGYCVESFKIIDLDSGTWDGYNAWVLSDEGSNLVLLVGHSLEEAIEVKERYDNDMPSLYDGDVVWCDAEEWVQQQEC